MKTKFVKHISLALSLVLTLNFIFFVRAESADKIVIGVEAGSPHIAFYKNMAPEYTVKTGVEIEFVELPHDNMHERLLQEAISGSGAIDIFNTDQPWVSEFASRGFLVDLTDKISQEDKVDFFPAALEASSWSGRLYSIPYFIHTPIVYYRTDLLEKSNLSVPVTWQEYAAVAKALTKNGIYGTIIEAKQANEPVTHLLDWLYQNGADVVDSDDNVLINSQEANDTFTFLLSMMYEDQSVMPGSVGYDCVDVHTLFMQGKVGMVKNWPYMFAMAIDPQQSEVYDKFAVALQPKGLNQQTAVWTWGFSISSASKHQEESWEFIQWATSAEQLAKLGLNNLNPVPRTSSLEIVKADTSLSNFIIDSIDTMTTAISFGRNATENPKFPSIQEQLSVTLSRIMTKQVSIKEGLTQAENAIIEILSD